MNTQSADLRNRLISFIRRKFASRTNICELAEDIVQQAFADTPQDKWNFAYLSVVCMHGAYRCFKRWDYEKRILTGSDENLWFMDDRDVVRELIDAQDAEEILNSLQILKDIERLVVSQRYYGDYSFAEIAQCNGMKLNTVLSHHRRALEKLRPHLVTFSQGRSRKHNIIAGKAFIDKISLNKGGCSKMTQKQLYELGILAERTHRLAFDIAMQSGQLGEDGRGIAVVADECRTLGNKLKHSVGRLLENPDFGLCMEQELTELETLAVNGSIESLRVSDKENGAHCSAQLAVIFDELRTLTSDLKHCMGQKTPDALWLTPAVKSSVLHKRLPFLLMQINGIYYTENVRLVQEILHETGYGHTLSLRGQEIPVADISRLPGKKTNSQIVAVLWRNFEEDGTFALPLDYMPTIFWSAPGIGTGCEDHLRERWACEENQQMRFPDYSKLL